MTINNHSSPNFSLFSTRETLVVNTKAKAANKECVYIQVQEDIDYLPVASVYCLRYQNNIGVDTYVPRQENCY